MRTSTTFECNRPRSVRSARRVRFSLLSCLLLGAYGCASQTPGATAQTSKAATLSAQELAAAGFALAAKGDDFSAEQYLVAAVGAGYPEGPLTRAMVESCIAGGRLERALSHAQSYVERHPEDWIFNHVLASIHFAKGDGHLARQVLTLVLLEHPEHAESHYLMGLVLRDQVGDISGAREAFNHYLSLMPSGAHHEEARAWLRRSSSFPIAVSASLAARRANSSKAKLR